MFDDVRVRMVAARRRRPGLVWIAGLCLGVCLSVARNIAMQVSGPNRLVPEPGRTEDTETCVGSAEGRLHSFFQDVGDSCHDPQRQRSCQNRLSRDAIPKLFDATLIESCDKGCPFHVIISEAGGKAVNKVALSAFLRAFVVTQPRSSILYIWSLPWDDVKVPDITENCSPDSLSMKLRDGSWLRRIKVKRFERADIGTPNLLIMLTYRLLGNQFRLLRSMVRLSDLLRFHLLQKYGGIYVDSDVLLLRDLTPLCNSTFTYRWSDKNAENSAVFGCPKNCRFVLDYIRCAGRTPLSYHPLKWRRVGRRCIQRWPVRLPTMVFDPVWLKQIGSDSYEPADYIFTKHEDFVKAGFNQSHVDSRALVFPASLGYHWHGGFASIPEVPDSGSTFQRLHELACF